MWGAFNECALQCTFPFKESYMKYTPTQEQLDKTYAQDESLGLPRGMTARQITQESGWNPTAMSQKGAYGYVQIIPTTLAAVQQQMGRTIDPTNFDDALAAHGHLMRQNLTKFGNIPDALRAYNSGWEPAKWNNPETNNYVATIYGDDAGGPSQLPQAGMSAVAKQLDRTSRLRGQTHAVTLENDASDAGLMSAQPDTSILFAAEKQSASVLAATTEHAGAAEAFAQAASWDTLAGDIKRAFQQDKPTEGWSIRDDQIKSMQDEASNVWGNDDLRNYVLGAVSDNDWAQRMANAIERADFLNRASNTDGFAKYTVGAAQLAAGMGDPVMLAATMGAGAAVNAARGAVAARSVGGLAYEAGAGAAGNVATEVVMREMRNQDLDAPALLQQALTGAALGAMGAVVFGDGHAPDPAQRAAGANLQGVAERNVRNPVDPTQRGALPNEGLIGSALDDVPAKNPLTAYEGKVAGEATESPMAKALATAEEAAARKAEAENAKAEQAAGGAAVESAESAEHTPASTFKSVSTIDDPRYNALHDAGVVVELPTVDALKDASPFHAKFGSDIPEDAKAFYSPQDDKVYVIRDRLTPEEAKNPTGIIMHEVGVHYGLERSIGTANYHKVLGSLEQSADPKVREALARVPSDTPDHLKLEEALGYLVEKHADLPVVQRIIAQIRNWLRENVGILKNLEVTTADAIAYVRGSVENVRRDGRLSADATFPYVWHGSPVKGIDQLDLKYSGTGEGNAGFGWGHYVTSEKGTALDYRNKEAQRRGLKAEDGGLYRLKVNTTRERMLDWTAPVTGKVANLLKQAGIAFDTDTTGATLYARLSRDLGSQRAASEALNAAGVHGIAYETGRSRGSKVRNSNYVLFGNEHLDVQNRYSRGAATAQRDDLALGVNAKKWAQAIDDHQEVKGAASQRAEAWYSSATRAKLIPKAVAGILDSVGNTLARSKSKGVRMVASMLAEDPSGLNRQHASSAALDMERLKHGFRQPFMEVYNRIVPALLSSKELLGYRMGYSSLAEKRIGRQVAEYRLAARKARMEGTPFDEAKYDPNIVTLGKHLDGFWGNIHEAGKEAGDPVSTAIGGKGFQGYMPYRWDWRFIHETHNTDPEKWNSLKQMFRDQYNAKVIEPAIADAAKAAATPAEIMALRDSLGKKVEHLVDNYLKQVMRSPEERLTRNENHLAAIAEQLLLDDFRGDKVTNALADEFKKKLNEIRKDRTRTEFDLLAEHNGVRMLDFIDADIGRMVDTASSRHGGQIALARRGLADESQIDGMKEALIRDGATPEDMSNIDFLIRSLKGEVRGDEFGAAKLMQQGAYAAMMGKLGFNALADAAGIITATGVSGMFKALGRAFTKDAGLMQSLRDFAPGALVHDPRLFNQTADSIHPNAAAGLSEGSFWSRAGQSAASAVGHLSGMHFVSKKLHDGLVPVLVDDIVDSIRTGKGISKARMEDMGLTADRVARIKEQLELHEAGRKRGEAIKWDQWDQTAADDLVAATQRATGQALQRAYVGEAPRWISETTVGRVIGQFRRFGFLASEKQSMRNAFIADSNSASAAVVGLGLAAAIYRAKLEANTLGMSASEHDKYIEDNFSGMKGMSGIMVMFNMSGMAADGLDAMNLLLGGQAHGGSSPVAALGYLSNLTGGVSALTSGAAQSVFGTEPVDWQRKMRQAWRMVPGANTIPGSFISNSLKD
ncbi:internal virion protein with endolysin domain [Ralstonia phage RS-PII-1]|uniref:Transglycosylase SLT domain-containing protein n=1 Tax=Ralstonia phage RS-PII-1 TaxID=1932892 RepID=A0A1L7DQA5_9CAUD|nr:internal virion protein with endolysin domain [Ralstonia phage RS-PII-1]APU00299.1 hypothetical protein [Ralstonia phage RS-PII-1]